VAEWLRHWLTLFVTDETTLRHGFKPAEPILYDRCHVIALGKLCTHNVQDNSASYHSEDGNEYQLWLGRLVPGADRTCGWQVTLCDRISYMIRRPGC
jgi:hypothetical protein